jgi:hypothetical protein
MQPHTTSFRLSPTSWTFQNYTADNIKNKTPIKPGRRMNSTKSTATGISRSKTLNHSTNSPQKYHTFKFVDFNNGGQNSINKKRSTHQPQQKQLLERAATVVASTIVPNCSQTAATVTQNTTTISSGGSIPTQLTIEHFKKTLYKVSIANLCN